MSAPKWLEAERDWYEKRFAAMQQLLDDERRAKAKLVKAAGQLIEAYVKCPIVAFNDEIDGLCTALKGASHD
jgi:hypothetical protein